MRSGLIATVFVVGLSASSSLAAYPTELLANARASAVGGCNGCGHSQDQTLITSVNVPLTSSAADNTAATGSFADAKATTEFGTLRVYAEAFLAAGDPAPDAQAIGSSLFKEYFSAGAFTNNIANLEFVISGSHTPAAGIIGPSANANLNYVFQDVTTGYDLRFGNWARRGARRLAPGFLRWRPI